MDKLSVFLAIDPIDYILETPLFLVIRDIYPVSPGHSLIISKQLRTNFFDLSSEEKHQLVEIVEEVKYILDAEFSPDGYNIGMNCGAAAGQTIYHFHCHVIPRYNGDMADPRGGIRHCVTGKGHY